MKAQVLYGINDLRFEPDYKEPELHSGVVLVRVRACGICGSDVGRILKNGTYHFPTIPGHEFSGDVVKVFGDGGEELLGRRVSVFPLIPCRKCNPCRIGEYQLCEHYGYLGSRSDGGFAEFAAVPVWNLMGIPEGTGYEEAAMLEPAAVALHALKAAGSCLGKTVAITGTGTIASILIQMAVIAGASKTIIMGRNHTKMEFFQKIFPRTTFIDTDGTDIPSCLADIVIEGTGAGPMLSIALRACTSRGTVVTMGNPSGDVHIGREDYWQILRKELTLRGTWNSSFGIAGKDDWNDVLRMLSDGRLRLFDLITHRIGLDGLMHGIRMLADKSENSNKIMVII